MISASGRGILDLVGGGAGEMVGGDIAHAIAAGLDGMHLHAGQLGKNVGHVHQLDPVELDILAGGEMAEALVIFARDMGQLAHLARRQGAIGHRDAQHIGVQLQIEAVHQPQRLELVFGQFAGQAARHLAAELRHPLGHELGVEFVVPIHVWLHWALRAWGLLAGIGTHAGAGGADDLAFLHGTDVAVLDPHLEQIGRHDLVSGDECLRRGQRRFGGGEIGENLAFGKASTQPPSFQ